MELCTGISTEVWTKTVHNGRVKMYGPIYIRTSVRERVYKPGEGTGNVVKNENFSDRGKGGPRNAI